MVLILQNCTGKTLIVEKRGGLLQSGVFLILFAISYCAQAQVDSIQQNKLDSLLSKPKGL
jgi:hypothetical protein